MEIWPIPLSSTEMLDDTFALSDISEEADAYRVYNWATFILKSAGLKVVVMATPWASRVTPLISPRVSATALAGS